jgi:2-keto-4-pentenoate hydratase/2-oxohepta-3-ene-1,7-dioic acid hydratase (catechol pathway)
MDQNRRTFLMATGAVGAATATANMALPTVPAQAAASPAPHAYEMARGMTLVNLRRNGGFGLGVKTERGILDVTLAAQALNMSAPADIDDLLQNGKVGMLKAVVDAAKANSAAERAVLPERGIEYAPAVTRPEKIIMMGFNDRKHAEETNTPIPKNPILFNKYNNALNCHGGTIKLPTGAATKFDYEVEPVIVLGKECRNVSEEQALDYVAGYAQAMTSRRVICSSSPRST